MIVLKNTCAINLNRYQVKHCDIIVTDALLINNETNAYFEIKT